MRYSASTRSAREVPVVSRENHPDGYHLTGDKARDAPTSTLHCGNTPA